MSASRRKIHVLGIESSCDDTGVAIVNEDGEVLSNSIHSQLREHLTNGGIIPTVARDYHFNNIDRVANQAFKKSGLSSVAEDVSAIAVSTRPGLNFSLQIGLNYARKLAKKYNKPLIPIHHMQAHALMPLLQNKTIRFPFLALLISGGHCLLSIARRYNEFHIMGTKLDDAPGDLLDKVARRLKLRNLGHPFDHISGGAAVELMASRNGADRFKYFNNRNSVPMLQIPNCDFSFSGYRGTLDVLAPRVDELWISGDREQLKKEISDICASLQRSMLIQLVKKLQRAIGFYRMYWRYNNEDAYANNVSTHHLGYELHKLEHDDDRGIDVVISGGVAANSYLVDHIRLACSQVIGDNNQVYTPSKNLCSDNGLMVAWNGLLRYRDYLDSKHGPRWQQVNLEDSVIHDANQMDELIRSAECPMGIDIRAQLKAATFTASRLSHPEFKMCHFSDN